MSASEQINNVVDKVADKLGVAVEKVEPLARHIVAEYQAKSVAVIFICSLFIVVFSVVAIIAARKLSGLTKDEAFDDDIASPRLIVLGVLCGISVVVIATCLPNLITQIQHAMAPTYYCLKELLGK